MTDNELLEAIKNATRQAKEEQHKKNAEAFAEWVDNTYGAKQERLFNHFIGDSYYDAKEREAAEKEKAANRPSEEELDRQFNEWLDANGF